MTRCSCWTSSALALMSLMALMSCQQPPELRDAAFNRLTFYLGDSSSVREIRQDMIADIDAATSKVDVAMTSIRDMSLAQALVRAKQRGVQVRVVGDEDYGADAGFVALRDAQIPVVLGDGELRYLPEPTLTTLLQDCSDRTDNGDYRRCTRRQGGQPLPTDGLMIRPGSYNEMSNQFLVIDDFVVYNLSSPDLGQPTLWVGWKARSQDFAIAFTREFQQMFGGVFSTTLTIYNGPLKSTVHGIVYDSNIPSDRPGRRVQLLEGYLTDQGLVELAFNPQQRLIKELIDEIYRARGSVYLMTDSLENRYVIDALAYKARYFDVRIIMRDGAPVPARLRQAGAVVRWADPSLTYVPTVFVNNVGKGKGGKDWPRVVGTISHKLYRGAPFEAFKPTPELGGPDDTVEIYPSDIFIDGSMWMMREANFTSLDARQARYDGSSVFDRFSVFWDQTWRASREVPQ